MYTYQLEKCGNKEFLFEFFFGGDKAELVDCQSIGGCYVSYRLLRKDKTKKNEVFEWKGCLRTDQSEPFELSFPDKIDIKGEMKLFKTRGQSYIWIDVDYCEDLEMHFEGNILEIPCNLNPEPIPDPVPHPVPEPEPLPDPMDPLPDPVISGDFNDLSPYLCLRRWPDLTDKEETYFMSYKGLISSPHVPNLYDRFLSNFNSNGIPAPDAREKITKEAFEFVNGVPPYSGQYISEVAALPLPYALFPAIYNRIQLANFTEYQELEEQILSELNWSSKDLNDVLISTSYCQLKDRVWQNVFALSVLNFHNIIGLQDEIKILLVCYLLEGLISDSSASNTSIKLEHLINASIVLPSPVFPLPATSGSVQNLTQAEGVVVPYAIGDLHMIQQKLIGYRAGEIAHIENVLSGEIKERSNKSSRELNEITVNTNESTSSTENQCEASLDGLNTEIGNTLTGADTTTDDYNKLETSYGPPTTGTYSGEVTTKREPALNEQTNDTHFAKKVLNQTVARMSRNIKQVFTRNQVNKTEEAVVNTLDNRTGDSNVRGIYNWVNKVYHARVLNYGNRFLLEFLIDQPFPKIAEGLALVEDGLIPPAKRVEPITSFESITRENYASLAAAYGVANVALPPDNRITAYAYFNEDKVLTAQALPILEGYMPSKAEVTYTISSDMKLLVGGTMIDLDSSQMEASPSKQSQLTVILNEKPDDDQTMESLPVVLNETASFFSPPLSPGFYVAVGVQCIPSGRLMNTWRIAVYDAIMKAYTANVATAKVGINEIKERNKSKIKNWMNQSITNSCKDLLYKVNIEKNTALQSPISSFVTDANQPAYYQFFDQAMEWDEITYKFYEGSNSLQKDKINVAIDDFHTDASFNQFIENKHLRIMVPVTPGCNNKILYYLSTGLVSYLGDKVTPVVEADKPVAVELKNSDKKAINPSIVNESWEILVPTNMQWLHDDNELPFNNELTNSL